MSHGDSLGWAAQLVPVLLLGLVTGCASQPGSACLFGLVGFAVLCNSVAGGAGHATKYRWRPLPEVLAEARDWIDEQFAVMSGSPVDGRLSWPRVSGAEASLFAALVNTSLWAEDFQETEDEPVCKKLCRHLPVCALLFTLDIIVVYQIALYAAFHSAWFQTGSHTKAQEDVSQCPRVIGAGVCARHAAACAQFLMGFIRAGDLKVASGPCWMPLQAVSLVAARGVRDLEKMSRCRRNVKIGKLRVLQGCKLRTRTRPATRGTQFHTTAVMAGIQKLLRDETDGVEVLVEPERHALAGRCGTVVSVVRFARGCRPGTRPCLGLLQRSCVALAGINWHSTGCARARLKVWYRKGRTGVSDVSARDSPVEA